MPRINFIVRNRNIPNGIAATSASINTRRSTFGEYIASSINGRSTQRYNNCFHCVVIDIVSWANLQKLKGTWSLLSSWSKLAIAKNKLLQPKVTKRDSYGTYLGTTMLYLHTPRQCQRLESLARYLYYAFLIITWSSNIASNQQQIYILLQLSHFISWIL